MDRTCKACGRQLEGRQQSWCSPVCREAGRGPRPPRVRPSGYARLTADQREDRQRGRNQTTRERRDNRTCIGVDGEGHEGAYFLLAAAGAGWERHVWSTEDEGLSTMRCFEFMASLPPQYTAWGFSFGYDVNMMLKDVSVPKLQRMHETGFLRWGPYRVHWLPGKMFRVSRYGWDSDLRRQTKKRLYGSVVWDMYPWQGRSFVAWLEDWGLCDDATLERIRSMKEQRADFDPEVERDSILAYCLDECRLLAIGAERLHSMMTNADMDLKTFHSPASASKYLMRRNGVERFQSKQNPPSDEIQRILEKAYFGGRAEACRVGPIEGPLWLHDIRSAYPTAMQSVPCLAHGHWEESEGPVEPWSLLEVSWNAPGALWGPLPLRPKVGSLKYPNKGRGWFWGPEVAGVTHLAPLTVHRRLVWRQTCQHEPFSYLAELYDERKRRKAAGDAAEYVLKIALNASYGATAERPRKGSFRPPRWRETAWAGYITAHCRGAIGAQLGPSVVMVATDGILASSPLPVVEGSNLGDWEVEPYDEGFVVGPGVYFLRKGGEWVKFKSRGIDARSFRVEDFQRLWEAEGREGVLPIPQRRFIGLGTALQRIHGMEPPGARAWRQFLDFSAGRSLSLEPRRRWAHPGNWDGRSLAPTPNSVRAAERKDAVSSAKLRMALKHETDPMKRTALLMLLSSISDADSDDGREFFREDDQPWN